MVKYVPSFLGVYPSDILPSNSVTRSARHILNTDPHIAKGMHSLVVHLQPISYYGYFFHSYGLPLSSVISWLFTSCVLRLGILHYAAAELDQYGLRQIYLFIHALFGSRVLS